ncbi:cytochrome d ubiquinol oxidase subunit II [Oleiphilus messinensis]|uniref:Cytochrome d ubiquinol oxidase subunit II n=1 Tax=Oleiphilus messinensis TaxID=141451 RepID=A0A1Y0IFD9_9GAMM|nr:cytochrome d ubiquinol oxidase subunit II [Oleiphilus messinensis]ARU58970.1 cytochrome d ubiquinol oxidase subunit II [Oleiphilus messinensis]
MDLALVYLLLMAVGILFYVLLDGFSLGVGIVSPWLSKGEEKALALKSLSHLWDSNQTWLVFGGVVLFVAFPRVYAAWLSTLYLPVILMLIALIFRGVAFEFYFKATTSRKWWDLSFTIGSSLAALCQGIIVGAVVEHIYLPEQSTGDYWLSPFSVLTGLALVSGYGLLGACWLIRKCDNTAQQKMRWLAQRALFLTLIGLAGVCFWVLFDFDAIAARWLSPAVGPWLLPVPILTLFVSYRLWRAIRMPSRNLSQDLVPLGWAMLLFVCAFIGLGAGLFPYIGPERLTFWEAVAPDASLTFSLFGIVLFLPMVIAYNIYNYRVFSGKTSLQDGY